MRIIIHCGMPKTGSSSIHHSLSKNSERLSIYYPRVRKLNHQVILNQAFMKVNEGKPKDKALTKLRTVLDDKLIKGRDVIFSAETLPNFSIAELAELHNFMKQYSDEVCAVAYVRAPKGYIESAFQQTLKGRALKSSGVAHFFAEGMCYDYRKKLEKFDKVFGKENVQFWKFDPASFVNHCVVQDFCQRFDIEMQPDSVVRVNEALSLGAVSLLYAYLRYADIQAASTDREKVSLLINLLFEYQDGKKLRFASNVINAALENRHADIEWIENRMGVSLSENIYKDDQDGIHSEAELLTFTPDTLLWLANQLGPRFVECWRPNMPVEKVANWVLALRHLLDRSQIQLTRN